MGRGMGVMLGGGFEVIGRMEMVVAMWKGYGEGGGDAISLVRFDDLSSVLLAIELQVVRMGAGCKLQG